MEEKYGINFCKIFPVSVYRNGAFIATVLVLLLNKIFLIHNPFSIIIMSLMPLVPGVQVTNAVRDFMAGDYLSGMIGIQAAIFVSTAIALGVVMGLKLV